MTTRYVGRLTWSVAMVFSGLMTSWALSLPGCSVVDVTEQTELGCASYADGFCDALQRCGPAFLAPYGSLRGCQSELARSCIHTLLQPDIFGTGAGAAVCGERMRELDCDSLLNLELPLECAAGGGRRRDDAPCSVGAQCASARCAKDTLLSEHGTCQERLIAGDACQSVADCQAGLICTLSGRCAALLPLGAACTDQVPCRSPFVCLQGMCQPVPPPIVPPQPQVACQQLAQNTCARLAACSPRAVDSLYGDVQTCASRLSLSCVMGLATPDAITSTFGVVACADALANVDCNALLENGLPDMCQLAPGARADGSTCGSDAQCASTRCARATVADSCGTCAPLAAAEGACQVPGDCSRGLVCTADNHCRAPAAVGGTCDDDHPCRYPLLCDGGRCAQGLAAGATCSINADRCDRYAGQYCNVSNRCESWLNAAVGQPCGYTSGAYHFCTASASCSEPVSGGTCQAALPDGAACSASGASCLPPARCVDGACSLAMPGACL
jgi:hypothetical protein